MDIPQFVHSSADKNLGYFNFLAITNQTSMNMCGHIFV